jgi:hypothetical protein
VSGSKTGNAGGAGKGSIFPELNGRTSGRACQQRAVALLKTIDGLKANPEKLIADTGATWAHVSLALAEVMRGPKPESIAGALVASLKKALPRLNDDEDTAKALVHNAKFFGELITGYQNPLGGRVVLVEGSGKKHLRMLDTALLSPADESDPAAFAFALAGKRNLNGAQRISPDAA